ncbi:MAG: glycosyltransferase family 4 protein, partial [Bryobacterales bacterium]|nr:glycosyltransferase family 4 protein [Bryobacterales bacterium]
LACMQRSRVVALPSKAESFGLAAIEAASQGVPIVYTTAGAGPEVVEHGRTGLLADPNDPRDVAEQVAHLLRDPACAARLASNGKAAATKRYSLHSCVDHTLRFYEACCSTKRMVCEKKIPA